MKWGDLNASRSRRCHRPAFPRKASSPNGQPGTLGSRSGPEPTATPATCCHLAADRLPEMEIITPVVHENKTKRRQGNVPQTTVREPLSAPQLQPTSPRGEALLRGSWAETQVPPGASCGPPSNTDPREMTPPPRGEEQTREGAWPHGAEGNATCREARSAARPRGLGGSPRRRRSATRTRPAWRGGHVTPGSRCQLRPRKQDSQQWLFFLPLWEMLSKL